MKTCVIVGQNYPDNRLAKMAAEHDRTIVFEPYPAAADAIRKAVGPDVVVFQAACWNRFCDSMLNVYNKDGLSSSLSRVTDDAKSRYSRFDLSRKDSIPVQVVDLQKMLVILGVDRIDNLIIDAQGYDLDILKTLQPLLAKNAIKHIECEADAEGFQHYADRDNSEDSFRLFMSRFPGYVGSKKPDRVSFQPDLVWDLVETI